LFVDVHLLTVLLRVDGSKFGWLATLDAIAPLSPIGLASLNPPGLGGSTARTGPPNSRIWTHGITGKRGL